MSSAHKGSRLLLSGNTIAVDFSTTYLNFNNDATGIQFGNFVQQSSNSVYTLRQYEGRFGGGIAIEEGTTNLISNTNGTASTLTTGGTTPPIVSLVNDTSNPFGTQSWQVTFPSGGTTGYNGSRAITGNYPIVSGGIYSSFAWINIPDGLENQVTLYNTGSWGTASLIQTGKKIGVWKEFKIQNQTVGSNGTNYLTIYLNASISSPLTLSLGACQTEQKGFSTSYVSGTRANGRATYPSSIINRPQGTVSCWVNSETSGAWRRIISFVGTNAVNGITDLNFDIEPTNIIRLKADPSYSVASTGNIGQLNTWYHVGCSWGSSGLKLYINGNLDSSLSTFTSGITIADSTISIGARQTDNADFLNGILSDMAIYQTQLSDEDMKAIFISNRPLYNPYDYRAIAY